MKCITLFLLISTLLFSKEVSVFKNCPVYIEPDETSAILGAIKKDVKPTIVSRVYDYVRVYYNGYSGFVPADCLSNNVITSNCTIYYLEAFTECESSDDKVALTNLYVDQIVRLVPWHHVGWYEIKSKKGIHGFIKAVNCEIIY